VTTNRERTVLQVISDAMPLPVTPTEISRGLGIGKGYAREVAKILTGRGLVNTRKGMTLTYTITDAGRRELDGHDA
jgi:predicted transcriptional regulator